MVAAGGVLDLGGFAQTTHVLLGGGTVQHGALMETDVFIDAASGTVDGLGGTTGLDARGGGGGGVVTLNTTTGANTYTGETDVVGIASARHAASRGRERIQPQQRNGCGRPHRRRVFGDA